MGREIQARIANFPFQRGQELLNNMLWLETKAGETSIPFLLEALEHDNPKVRCSATWVLGRLRDRRVIPDYGHIDCIFGKNAAVEVYPHVLAHLDKTA